MVLGGAVLLLALGWLFFQGGSTPGPPRGDVPAGDLQSVAKGGEPAPPPAARAPLPGAGPLVVELDYLGRADEEQIAPRQAGSLEGRIVRGPGQGIAGARIEIVSGPQAGWNAVSDEKGRYRFPEILPGTQLFRITRPDGYRAGREQRVLSRGRTWRDFQVGAPAGFEIHLTDHEGEPAEGAAVRLDLGTMQQTAGKDGVVRFQGVPQGRVLADVSFEGHVPLRRELNINQAGGPPIEFSPLPRGGVVRGHVLSWPGGPLPTVTVVPIADRPGDQVVWERWQNVTTDPQGRFRLEGLPLTRGVTVRVFHPEGVSRPPFRGVRPSPHEVAPLEFVIARSGSRVSGRITGPGGAPLSGVRVVLEASDPQAVLAALYPGLAEGPVSSPLPVPAPLRRTWTTGADGSFDFAYGDHPRGSGTLVLLAGKEGFAPARRLVRYGDSKLRITLRPEQRDGELVLRMRGGAPLPPVAWYLDGAAREDGRNLQRGLYRVRIRRGDEEILAKERFSVGPGTELFVR